MTDEIFPETLFRPWSGNPLRSRADVEAALRVLARPVERYRSPGGARLRLSATGAHFDQAAADLEGYARLLWGLAPAQAGGAEWIDWTPIARGLAHGCDPAHREFWGWPGSVDQRLVELAAIGFALRLVPEKLWEPLDTRARALVIDYLRKGHACEFADNNWKFFRLMIGMGLSSVGADYDRALDERYAEELEAFYLGDGWYSDGNLRRADHYIPFAFHFYGPLLAALQAPKYAAAYRERARLIAPDVARWFADDGPALVFGRSMTYRFAIAGFWGALAFVGEEALPWGRMKGFYLRNLRWWAQQPMAERDGILPVGYGYPNLHMCESYNSPQSPYWAFKAFLPLALPPEHPFWASEEEPCPPRAGTAVLRHIGMVVVNPPGDAIALVSGQQIDPGNRWARHAAHKYAKFAYSARYGFSVESDPGRQMEAVLDNMIGFSRDGQRFRVREHNEEVLLADEILFARWRPFHDVAVETWLYWQDDHHVRVHRVTTQRRLFTTEGGFAVPRPPGALNDLRAGPGEAVIRTPEDLSALIDLSRPAQRIGKALIAPPNTNLVAAKSLLPQLVGEVPEGVSVLACAVIAGRRSDVIDAAIRSRSWTPPDLAILEDKIAKRGRPIGLMRRPSSR
jgi:hypothetical protein